MSALDVIDIEAAKAAFGEPEIGYFKARCNYRAGQGRREGRHFMGDYVEVSKEEYDANHEASQRLEVKRFMNGTTGKDGVRTSFYIYERLVKRPGWPQALMKELKEKFPERLA